MKTNVAVMLVSLTLSGLSGSLMASSDSKDVQTLDREVRALKSEVAQLRTIVELLRAIQPTITSLMPEFAERFHVMHYAGEAQDWAVVSHELQGLKRVMQVIKLVDPEKGGMIEGFMGGNFNQIEAAIEHENMKSFNKALEATVNNCNSCHVATGSPFMKVVLDAQNSLSMRHSHDLGKSEKPGEHMHKHAD